MPAEPADFPGRPSWASDRLVDESFIEYSYPLGSVGTCGDDPAFDVVVIQQDQLDLDADPPTITRHTPEIRLGSVRISPDQAGELADVLNRGVEFVKSMTAGD